MMNWQTTFSLLIVAAAIVQLCRLLFGKNNGCGNCASSGCSTSQNSKHTLVELGDETQKKL